MTKTCQKLFTRCAIGLSLLLCLTTSQALEEPELAGPIYQLRALAQHMQILQPAQHADGLLGINEIIEIDALWTTDPAARLQQLNEQVQVFLQGILDQPGSPFVSLILMGSQGETLGASPVTEHYWQGDSPKFIHVMADENLFIEDMDWDESKQALSASISVPVMDSQGEMYGVLSGAVKASLKSLADLRSNINQ